MAQARGRHHRKHRRLCFERVESRRLLAADMNRGFEPMDINEDGDLSAGDALMLINRISRHRNGESSPAPAKMDLNGDGDITAADVIQIINRLAVKLFGNHPGGLEPEFRSIDGSNNNLRHREWGSAGSELARIVDMAYADGIGEPSGPDRPSPRLISNLVSAQHTAMPNERGLSDMVWQWGQFIDHDIDLTAEGDVEFLPVSVPQGDLQFDPSGTGSEAIGFTRSAVADGSGDTAERPRQQINQITAFIDGSMIYGSDSERTAALRAFRGGRLKTSQGDLLPMNEAGLPNAGGNGDSLFLAGDIRANEQVGLTTMHTLWVREHNRLADEIAADNPSFSDESVYQRARRLVIAQIQAITFNEYLPAVLGSDAISPYRGYDPRVQPTISNLFATAAFRFGHTQLSSELKRLNDDGTEIAAGPLPLRQSFFNPAPLKTDGIDSVLKGLANSVSQEIDTHLVEDVRSFLFGAPGEGGFDLASLNIQRGRDHGLPDYNSCRVQLGLGPVESFSEITSDPELAQALEQAYATVDAIDVWVAR